MADSRHSRPEERGYSSAVSAVLYSHNNTEFAATRGGAYVYTGDASSFHEWEFRTRIRIRGLKGEAYIKAVSGIVEGLRGDAFVVAQEVGLDVLMAEGKYIH